jgi:hypothetical protein
MKRRKPPILLVSILLILVSVMFIGAFAGRDSGPQPRLETDEVLKKDGQKELTPEQLAAQAADAAARARKPQAHSGVGGPVPASSGQGDGIHVTNQSPYHQKPKPPAGGATNGQWYRG